jgi:HEAT repeat protein
MTDDASSAAPGDLEAYLSQLVERMRSERDAPWHSLVDLGSRALPYLCETYSSHSKRKRQLILSVINQSQSRDALPILAKALADPAEQIWKTALDGLVTLGGLEALEFLTKAREGADNQKLAWLEEARHQILDNSTE